MIYQVRANLYFDDEDEARDFYHDCQVALGKAAVIHPGGLNEEFSLIELIENHHDEHPRAPCDCIERRCSYPPPPD